MQRLINRYLLIAAALFLALSGYAVPAQNNTPSPPALNPLHAQKLPHDPTAESKRLPALAGWFDLMKRYYALQSQIDKPRLEAAGGQTLVVSEKLPGNREIVEYAW